MEAALFQFLAKHIVLTEEEKVALLDFDLFRTYPKGHILLHEGAFAQAAYFVIKGCLRCYYLDEGEEKTTAFYMEEEGVTPESLINQSPSTYYISCEETSVVLVSTPQMEQTIFQKFPKFETLCRILSEKELANQQVAFAKMFNSTPEERYLHLIKTKPQLLQRVPQYQIASYIGIKPESLSRIRKRLNDK
ncbi:MULTISPECIES: Crp/Fnr family transcriptional regulator [unclassified Aureispira]|uniref:Crp/Fnr family transcriptional regulator n=1 Tax=unclassified Aureispira TaxID=2649989 RepID=UPI000696CC0F|nr:MULTISPECIES: Crp/Fnr family transcriptional regulator [unclassified Aureispira]WMX12966.1 Crp/Fnr family transcriptional regulator [Aureispira sp. CCB-E]